MTQKPGIALLTSDIEQYVNWLAAYRFLQRGY